MRNILILSILFQFSCISNNEETSLECDTLNFCLNDTMFTKEFLFAEMKKDTVVIIDTAKYFEKCINIHLLGKEILLKHELVSKKEMKENNGIIMLQVGSRDNIITYGFWCPSHGGALNFNFRETKEKEMTLVDYDVMDF